MGACSRCCVVAYLLVSLSLQPLVTGSSWFDDIALLSNATILNYTTQLGNSSLFRYLSTTHTPVPNASNVSGLELVQTIASDIANEIRQLEELLTGTARQLVEHYAKKRGEPCCYDKCSGSSACFLACRMNMSSLRDAYTVVRDSTFSDSQLTTHPNFEVAINTSEVALYTPINILVNGRETLCSLEWMDLLGDLFKSNRNNTIIRDAASYQYFASVNGSMVYYPASNWVRSNVCPRCPAESGDSYDARLRPWYTQTIQGSVYLVILLDMSGTMTGFRSLLARLTIVELLKTLTENDFFYVIRVDGNPRPFGCLNRTRASRENILSMNSLITSSNPSPSTGGSADYQKGLEVSFEALNEAEEECHVVMAIFADDDADITASDMRKYTNVTSEQVRIFTFQVGMSERSLQLEAIATTNGGIFRQLGGYTDIFPAINDFGWELRKASRQPSSSVFFNRYRDTFGNLVLSLSTPVIHHGNTSTNLGVMGMDVPLKTLTHIIQRKLGSAGYGFLVDNNGQLVSHPLLKKGWPLLPDGLVSLDMERFEIPDQRGRMEPLRRAMLQREVGSWTVVAWEPANRIGRTSYVRRNMTYFYAPVNGTSVSIAIAMSSEGVRSVGGAQREYPVTAGNVAGYFVLEDLPYCTPAQLSEWNLDPTKQPKLFLETLSNAWTSASVLCDLNLCGSLLADYATVRNISLDQSEASDSWFVQFSSGLTWCAHDGTNTTNVSCSQLASTSYLSLVRDRGGPVVVSGMCTPLTHAVPHRVVLTGVASSAVLVTPIKASSDLVATAVVGKLIARQQLFPTTSIVEPGVGELFLLDANGETVGAAETYTHTGLSAVAMEILVTRDVYTSVEFIGFELTPCSLKETTAGHCQLSDVSPIQTSCEAFPKDVSSCPSDSPTLCYTNLTLYSLQRSSQNQSSSSPSSSLPAGNPSLMWSHLYGHLLLVVVANMTAAPVESVGVSRVDVCSCLDCEIYRVLPWDSAFCNTTVVNTGASWAMLPQLSIVLSMYMLASLGVS